MRTCHSLGPDRDHAVYRYTDQIYKIVQWYNGRPCVSPSARSEFKHHDEKLASSVSRSRRVVLEKALCNKWDWFCTFTISADKADREDLQAYWKRFSQWLRDLRKLGSPIKFVFVPERHMDVAWHMHGLISGIPDSDLRSFRDLDAAGYRSAGGRRLPYKLRRSSYFCWMSYLDKFGFCSLGRIKEPVACAFYITKYITKDLEKSVSDVGMHLYYSSRGLVGASHYLDFYGRDALIEQRLVNKSEFCATGFTKVADGLDWTFLSEYWPDQLLPLDTSSAELEALQAYDFSQLTFDLE